MTAFFLELTVADWVLSQEWYRLVIPGLTTILSDPDRQFILYQLPGTNFQWALKGHPRAATPDPASPIRSDVAPLVRLHLLVNDLPAEVERLATLGIQPVDPPKTSDEGYERYRFQDPDGYEVLLFRWTGAPVVEQNPGR